MRDGCPVLEDGRVLEVSNVIWCTGYTPDFSWIDLALPTTTGSPSRTEGSSSPSPALASWDSCSSIRSARRWWAEWAGTLEHIVDHIASRRVGTWSWPRISTIRGGP